MEVFINAERAGARWKNNVDRPSAMLIISRYAAQFGQFFERVVRGTEKIKPPSCSFRFVEAAFLGVFRKPKRALKYYHRAFLIGFTGQISFVEDQQGITMGLGSLFKFVAGGVPAFGKPLSLRIESRWQVAI
jgi:hypothetical protein